MRIDLAKASALGPNEEASKPSIAEYCRRGVAVLPTFAAAVTTASGRVERHWPVTTGRCSNAGRLASGA